MLKDKKYWKGYYLGNKSKIKKLILNSKLDRMRYYLNKNNVVLSTTKLKKNINNISVDKLIKYLKSKNHKIPSNKQLFKRLSNFDLVNFIFISDTLNRYYKACGFKV